MPPIRDAADIKNQGTIAIDKNGNKWLSYPFMKKGKHFMVPEYKWIQLDNYFARRKSPPFHASEHKWETMWGVDINTKWVSKPDKNKIYHWVLCSNKKNIFDYYATILPPEKNKLKYDYKEFEKQFAQLAKELKKYKILATQIKGFYGEIEFTDYTSWDFSKLAEKKGYNPDENYMYFSEYRLYWGARNGIIYLQWHFDRKNHQIAFDLLKKYFGKRVKLPLSINKAIQIKLNKI
jgi:hypothetical protein